MTHYKIIDSNNNQNEIILSEEKELRDVLNTLAQQGNRIVLLEFPDAGILTIGIGHPYGFVEYMAENGNPPYLLAINNTYDKTEVPFVEFDSGGTVTSIPKNNCLSFETVMDIVAYFLKNKELPKYVQWVQV
jgi:hypothetical protein